MAAILKRQAAQGDERAAQSQGAAPARATPRVEQVADVRFEVPIWRENLELAEVRRNAIEIDSIDDDRQNSVRPRAGPPLADPRELGETERTGSECLAAHQEHEGVASTDRAPQVTIPIDTGRKGAPVAIVEYDEMSRAEMLRERVRNGVLFGGVGYEDLNA